jgi:hypothetical protein
MKKIGIITFINTINYGASLQAFALQEFVISLGYEVEVLQYLNMAIEEKEKNDGKISFRKIIKKIMIGIGIEKKVAAFQSYENKHFQKGMTLSNATKKQVNLMYDCFITGSDQVWNVEITQRDWTYFLDFVEDDRKKVSYAPSMGSGKCTENDVLMMKPLLEKFKAVSIREQTGAHFLKQTCGVDSTVVVDPTLLLNKNEWTKRISFLPKIDHYILVYLPHDKKHVFKFVKKLKQKTGLPVVYLSISPRPQKGVKTIYDSSPDEFLGWMLHADYVVTGSFHGTAFSINLEKQFYYEKCDMNGRVANLVKLTGTEDRCLDSEDVLNQIIDYTIVREKLTSSRLVSSEWLKEILNTIAEE